MTLISARGPLDHRKAHLDISHRIAIAICHEDRQALPRSHAQVHVLVVAAGHSQSRPGGRPGGVALITAGQRAPQREARHRQRTPL